mmetsp:Transcript_162065/g.514910  ORF Transcript_162065/g.514910 Transcript_162065/m.514910 type:complete len:177 (-) Transcript_162065:554-1084(-)
MCLRPRKGWQQETCLAVPAPCSRCLRLRSAALCQQVVSQRRRWLLPLRPQTNNLSVPGEPRVTAKTRCTSPSMLTHGQVDQPQSAAVSLQAASVLQEQEEWKRRQWWPVGLVKRCALHVAPQRKCEQQPAAQLQLMMVCQVTLMSVSQPCATCSGPWLVMPPTLRLESTSGKCWKC